MTAEDLRGKTITFTSTFTYDVECDTDWIELIQERIGNDEFDEDQLLEFLTDNGYIDFETDVKPNLIMEID